MSRVAPGRPKPAAHPHGDSTDERVRQAAHAGEVRIVGGQWRRSKLPVLDRPGLRPTPDRVRETLFNWLGQDLAGWRCLDAFAGSGALGFEAASRGAAEVLLLDSDAVAVQALDAAKQRLHAAAVLRICQKKSNQVRSSCSTRCGCC